MLLFFKCIIFIFLILFNLYKSDLVKEILSSKLNKPLFTIFKDFLFFEIMWSERSVITTFSEGFTNFKIFFEFTNLSLATKDEIFFNSLSKIILLPPDLSMIKLTISVDIFMLFF